LRIELGRYRRHALAVGRPDLIRSLVLLDTTADEEPYKLKYKAMTAVARLFGVRFVARAVMPALYGKTALNDPARADERAEWMQQLVMNRSSIWRAANGVLERAEATRFVDVVRGSRLAAADDATAADLHDAFDELVQTLLARPAAGRSECLRVLADFGFDAARSQIIWSATQAALVADSALDAAERVAESEIREALQIRPSRG